VGPVHRDGIHDCDGAFVYGLLSSSISADYFQSSKETREAAVAGSDLATQKAFIESTKA